VVLLAVPHPLNEANGAASLDAGDVNVVVLRNTFWQGAGSPFGARPVWLPDDGSSGEPKQLSAYPIAPLDHVLTTDSENGNIVAWHPRRPLKPKPGSVLYSRYIPHLKEMFSMVALDYRDESHLSLFHSWQNDPRVSQGWNETGTLDQHRKYLRRAHEDPHRITILARFDDTFFAYFEAYWAKVRALMTNY
jgi:N5-hydroxy-L-ornithine N5-transacylase